MGINNLQYGGFVVSKNVLKGIPVRYSFREKSVIPQLNGWTLYSEQDGDDYVCDSKNFVVVNAETLHKVAPIMLEIFNAQYGANLYWMYNKGVHVGFYDLNMNKEISIDELLSEKE